MFKNFVANETPNERVLCLFFSRENTRSRIEGPPHIYIYIYSSSRFVRVSYHLNEVARRDKFLVNYLPLSYVYTRACKCSVSVLYACIYIYIYTHKYILQKKGESSVKEEATARRLAKVKGWKKRADCIKRERENDRWTVRSARKGEEGSEGGGRGRERPKRSRRGDDRTRCSLRH